METSGPGLTGSSRNSNAAHLAIRGSEVRAGQVRASKDLAGEDRAGEVDPDPACTEPPGRLTRPAVSAGTSGYPKGLDKVATEMCGQPRLTTVGSSLKIGKSRTVIWAYWSCVNGGPDFGVTFVIQKVA